MLPGMTLSRRLRRWVSAGMMVAVLFTQLAVAAYSCPAPVVDALPTAMASAMPDCHEMEGAPDAVPAPLCKAHCSNEAQSSARGLTPDLEPNPASMALLVRVIEPAPAVSLATAFLRAPPPAHAIRSLPIYLSLHVLRN